MYFSQNITYHYEPIDRKKPHLGRQFVTMEQMRVMEENTKRRENTEQRKAIEEEKKKFEAFLTENFTKEEVEFLMQNWTPPEKISFINNNIGD